jgi:2-dehydro-3-deoxyphosphogluconate aldolase/(4S)-4-hydroxy-2-oxoglutarate aldolase
VAEALVRHEGIDAVGLTGGTRTGDAVARAAWNKHLLLELGGNGPVIVLDDADLELAGRAVASAAFTNAGQVCSAAGRVLVDRTVADALADALAHTAGGSCWARRTRPATIPSWATLLDRLRSAHPDVCIGMGTITDPDTADAVARAGAAFGVTPYPVPGARARLAAYDLPLLEGGATPGEVLGAARAGVAKLFPAHIGGPEYLRSLLAVAPDARIMPTGGVALDDVPAWLRAGAYAVGVGSDLAQGDVAARLSRVLGEVGE